MNHTTPHKRYSEIRIAALTGEISADILIDDLESGVSRSVTFQHPFLEQALPDLAEGGYVIDLRPLANHPKLTTWVWQAPMPSGRIAGEEINRFSDEMREAAQSMLPGMEGTFQDITRLVVKRVGEPDDGSAGPLDYVSAYYRARWWHQHGARIGKRVGESIHWSDGTQQAILPSCHDDAS